jgi:hypothetical protein
MATIDITDEAGNTVRIANVEEMNALLARIEARRDGLADRMLGSDVADARAAEALSDKLEDIYIPKLMEWIKAFNVRLEAEADAAHRRAKAQAIKARKS